jgi:alpha-galactosidase
MSFGLWVEPEMVSPESDLFRRHPDWAIRQDMREASLGRHQLILDLANPEVVDYLYETLSALFARAKVEYVKWDMNRNFSDSYSKRLPADRQCEFCHRYALGLYGLIGRLTEGFPDILFESCSSGGNRFDLGMLYYMPQTWTSDDTDAVERYAIQYGTSVVYPPSTMGAHVSGMPSHQVLRSTSIETRFNVAAFGLLGYELDLTRLSPSDIEAVEAQIAFYKEHRQLLQFGSFYRLSSPFEGNHCSWMVVSEDKGEAILGCYQRLQEASPGLESIRLQGLDEDGYYDIEARVQFTDAERGLLAQAKEAYAAGGDELMYAGFRPMSQFMGTGLGEGMHFIGDFGSRIYRLKRRG